MFSGENEKNFLSAPRFFDDFAGSIWWHEEKKIHLPRLERGSHGASCSQLVASCSFSD